jgi:hypothetical protein
MFCRQLNDELQARQIERNKTSKIQKNQKQNKKEHKKHTCAMN